MGTIIATNVKQLDGGCGTAESVAALSHVPHPGYTSVPEVSRLSDFHCINVLLVRIRILHKPEKFEPFRLFLTIMIICNSIQIYYLIILSPELF